jgi:hypothetical protein
VKVWRKIVKVGREEKSSKVWSIKGGGMEMKRSEMN